MKIIEWIILIAATAGEILRDADSYRTAYRFAAAAHHPDRNGDPVKWKTLQECATVLRAHFQI